MPGVARRESLKWSRNDGRVRRVRADFSWRSPSQSEAADSAGNRESHQSGTEPSAMISIGYNRDAALFAHEPLRDCYGDSQT